jgi:hypothetical protein
MRSFTIKQQIIDVKENGNIFGRLSNFRISHFPSINGPFCPDLRSPRVSGCGIQGRMPHRKSLCGLDPDKNCSFMNWKRNVAIPDLVQPALF